MTLGFHLRFAGIGLFLLAAAHLLFPRQFRWREELGQLSLLNRQIFLVHTFFICLVLVMMGALSAVWTKALLQPTPLARLILGGFALFWSVRLIFQWFVYDSRLWKGDRLHTAMHLLFTGVWAYLTAVYGYGWWVTHP